jgi:PPOX class probable F420-dependent enzyme
MAIAGVAMPIAKGRVLEVPERLLTGKLRAMATLTDPDVRALLEQPNYAVVSTLNANGSIHSTMVWISAEDGAVAVNSAVGRLWPTNLERDPRVTVLVFETGNPYNFVEIRGKAAGSLEDADDHINTLAKKYINQDEYPYRRPGEQRIKYVITPEHIRHVKQ